MTTHAILKPMTVEGIAVTVEQQTKAIEIIRNKKAFTFHDVIMAMNSTSVPSSCRYRAADRLLQNLRKQKLITFGKEIPGYWTWLS